MKTRLLNLFIVAIGLMMMSFVSATSESNYTVVSSNVFIAGAGKANNWKLQVENTECGGKFVVNADGLQDISGLNFNFSVDQLSSTNQQNAESLKASLKDKNCGEITFSQKNIMILPIMRMVHIIGEFKIGDDVHAVPMQMQYEINNDGSISLNAKQFVKLSAFGIKLPNVKAGDLEEEVTINISLKLAKQG